jgi:hypothetical protein
MCRQARGMGSGGTLFSSAVDIVETRVKIHLYTPRTKNRLCDADNDELMAVINCHHLRTLLVVRSHEVLTGSPAIQAAGQSTVCQRLV